MNGIEQIGLANTITTTYSNDTFRKAELLVEIVFELIE